MPPFGRVARSRRQRLFFYVNLNLGWLLLVMAGLAACAGEPPSPPTPTLPAEAASGQLIFRRECSSCHALTPDTVIVGPSLAHIATLANSRIADQDARQYLLTSLTMPDAYLVDGYANLMPGNFNRRLTGEEIDALMAFLLTLE